MDKFIVSELPEHDRQHILRGYCPWCLDRLCDRSLVDGQEADECPTCGDLFYPNKRTAL